jgi:hypothetical protein
MKDILAKTQQDKEVIEEAFSRTTPPMDFIVGKKNMSRSINWSSFMLKNFVIKR